MFGSGKLQFSSVSFKPKAIHVLSSNENVWFAETADQVAVGDFVLSSRLCHGSVFSSTSVRTPVSSGRKSMIAVVLLFSAGMSLSVRVRQRRYLSFPSRSGKTNSLVINQHSRFIKLLDVATYRMTSILTDVVAAKLFSRYLLAKRSNTNVSERERKKQWTRGLDLGCHHPQPCE